MRIFIYCGFKKLDPIFEKICLEYTKRVAHQVVIELRFFKNEKEFIQALDSKPLIALTPEGKSFTSEGFSTFLFDQLEVKKELHFVIGGAEGLPSLIRSQNALSLSKMTLPHQMATTMLIEQIYRGWTIHHHLPYHK